MFNGAPFKHVPLHVQMYILRSYNDDGRYVHIIIKFLLQKNQSGRWPKNDSPCTNSFAKNRELHFCNVFN